VALEYAYISVDTIHHYIQVCIYIFAFDLGSHGLDEGHVGVTILIWWKKQLTSNNNHISGISPTKGT